MAHDYLSGGIYQAMGRFNGMVAEAKEAIRLNPDYPASYALLMYGDMALNRLDEANAVYRQALERKLYHPFYPVILYQIAFLQNDAAGMKQQVSLSAGQPGKEDALLAYEADAAAYDGRLREAGELTRRAMESAERAGKKEKAATFSATYGLREALFGNTEEARRRAKLAMEHSAGVDVQYGSALALAFAGRHWAGTRPEGGFGQTVPGSYHRAVQLPTNSSRKACAQSKKCFRSLRDSQTRRVL
jgi:tetratricopeptide (TPR) repeat protein